MSVIAFATRIYKKFTRLQVLMWVVLVTSMVLLFAVGFYLGRNSVAAALRDCSPNAISNDPNVGGGCGALSPEELKVDLTTNSPSDLQTIFADSRIGLTPDLYDKFAKEAKMGVITRSGELIIDDQVVMTGVWTMGRTDLGGAQPTEFRIGDKVYYHSAPEASFGDGIQSLPAMALFDENGTVKTAVLAPCANPVTKGKKVESSASCDKLRKKAVEGKKNTYEFTTDASVSGLAKIKQVDYYVDEGNGPEHFRTEQNPKTPVVREFDRDATVIAKVTVTLPGDKTKVVESEMCMQHVKVEKDKPQPKEPEQKQPKPEKPQPKPEKPAPLPITGPAGAVGVFAGTSLAGVIGHQIYTAYQERRRR